MAYELLFGLPTCRAPKFNKNCLKNTIKLYLFLKFFNFKKINTSLNNYFDFCQNLYKKYIKILILCNKIHIFCFLDVISTLWMQIMKIYSFPDWFTLCVCIPSDTGQNTHVNLAICEWNAKISLIHVPATLKLHSGLKLEVAVGCLSLCAWPRTRTGSLNVKCYLINRTIISMHIDYILLVLTRYWYLPWAGIGKCRYYQYLRHFIEYRS